MGQQYKRQWDVNSFTNPRKTAYKVSERVDGGWECSCPAWTMHTPRKDCKHIQSVRSAMRRAPSDAVFVTLQVNADRYKEFSEKAQAAAESIAALRASEQAREVAEIREGSYSIRRRRDDAALVDTATAAPARKRGKRTL